jgi:hypothetical protein
MLLGISNSIDTSIFVNPSDSARLILLSNDVQSNNIVLLDALNVKSIGILAV